MTNVTKIETRCDIIEKEKLSEKLTQQRRNKGTKIVHIEYDWTTPSLLYKNTFYKNIQAGIPKTRPDTRRKMRLVCVLFTFENNTGQTDGPTDGPTDGRTDTTSYRDATAHLKIRTSIRTCQPQFWAEKCFFLYPNFFCIQIRHSRYKIILHSLQLYFIL